MFCEAEMERLNHKCNRLRLLATFPITITNKQNNDVINYDYIESYRNYNCSYICLETLSEIKQKPIGKVSRKYTIRHHAI